MGSVLTSLSECPLQEEPICFQLQDNFLSTGERKSNIDKLNSSTDNYQKQQEAFLTKLTEIKQKNQNWLEERYSLWDEAIVNNLQVTYSMFALPENGLMNFKNLYFFSQYFFFEIIMLFVF